VSIRRWKWSVGAAKNVPAWIIIESKQENDWKIKLYLPFISFVIKRIALWKTE